VQGEGLDCQKFRKVQVKFVIGHKSVKSTFLIPRRTSGTTMEPEPALKSKRVQNN